MSNNELTAKIRELKQLQAPVEEANAEAEAIKDELKALMVENNTEEMTVDVYKVRYTTVKSNQEIRQHRTSSNAGKSLFACKMSYHHGVHRIVHLL